MALLQLLKQFPKCYCKEFFWVVPLVVVVVASVGSGSVVASQLKN